MTLDAFTYNREIKSFLAELIKHPKLIKDHDLDKNYNFWYSPNIMDTGFAYLGSELVSSTASILA
mgnify:CR=1 FL=1